jgi:hypothetical protein
MKQAADKFTKDAFDAPRRGRPPVANPKTGADRQAAYRARQRQALISDDSLLVAQAQLKEIDQIRNRLNAFRDHWAGADERVEKELIKSAHALLSLSFLLQRISVTRNDK